MRNQLRRFAEFTHFDKSALAPLVLAAFLRIGLMALAFFRTGTQAMTQGDTSSYLEPGRNLILHGGFTTMGLPETDRTPGYPIFAMLTGMIVGNVLLTILAQILVSLISLLLVRKIANQIFPDRNCGLIAAWLFAIEPLTLVSTIRIMPETLFVFLILLMTERVLAFQQNGRFSGLIIAGTSLAVATYVRPVSYYLVFPLAAGLAVTAGKHRGLRWKAPLVLLISVLPFLAAWQVRNYIETGYSGFSSIVEQNLYFFQSAEVTAELKHISLGAEQSQLGYPDESDYIAMHPDQRRWSASQRLHFMKTEALRILSQHPGLYLKTHIAGLAMVAFTPGATELLQLVGAYPSTDSMPHRILNEGVAISVIRVMTAHPAVMFTMVLLEIFLLLLYGFAISGTLSARNSQSRSVLYAVIGISLYFLLISGGAQAVGRYRLPIMPALCILAAGGLPRLRQKKSGAIETPLEHPPLQFANRS